jgi:predicted Zn-ribbon and HTH transcriptional regulator
VKITFGAFSATIKSQLLAQRLRVPDENTLALLQRQADAIVLLSVNDLLLEAQVVAARKRLLRKIAAHVLPGKPKPTARITERLLRPETVRVKCTSCGWTGKRRTVNAHDRCPHCRTLWVGPI